MRKEENDVSAQLGAGREGNHLRGREPSERKGSRQGHRGASRAEM